MARRLPLLLLLLLFVACSGGGVGDPPATRPVGVQIGYQSPDFALPRLDGKDELKLSDLQGKVVLVSFWASWCGPCRVEVPALEEAWQRYKSKDVVILGVSVDDTRQDAVGFLASFPVTYPMALDVAGAAVSDPWQVYSLPTTIVIDKAGVVRRRHIGFTPRQLRETLAEVDELLQEQVR